MTTMYSDAPLPTAALVAGAASARAASPSSISPDPPPATYWPAEAERGERVFSQTCAMCHARSQFVGESFVETWNNRRVFDFYALVRSTMPLTNPGGLKEDEYLALVSYLLKANHAEAGADS